MRVKVTSKGGIVLPAVLRKRDGLKPGDLLELERVRLGQYRLTKVRPRQKGGLLDWLLACPEKDWFCPMPPSELTDTIQSPFDE